MDDKQRKQKIQFIVIIAVTLAIIAAMIIVYYTVIVPKSHEGEKTVSLSIVYADNAYNYDNVVTKTNTVYELLVELNEAENLQLDVVDSSYGKYLQGLKGSSERPTDSVYYVFLINGEFAQFGIDAQTIADGDSIEFRLVRYSADYSSSTQENEG